MSLAEAITRAHEMLQWMEKSPTWDKEAAAIRVLLKEAKSPKGTLETIDVVLGDAY
jgi:hypothetical protein